MINAVTISEIFDDVCDSSRYLMMDIMEHRERIGNPMSTEETLATWDKIFDMVWQKRISAGKGN